MGSNSGLQLINAYIGYNTFIGLPNVTQAVLEGGTKTTHTTSVFENNVIYAPAGVAIKNRATDPMSGLKARNNVIHRPGGVGDLPNWLAAGARSSADPRLQNPAARNIIDNGGVLDDPPDGGNNFSVNNYKLLGNSPAIGAAATSYPFNSHPGVALARTKDYFGRRGPRWIAAFTNRRRGDRLGCRRLHPRPGSDNRHSGHGGGVY